jgi:hypothetical protein
MLLNNLPALNDTLRNTVESMNIDRILGDIKSLNSVRYDNDVGP